MHIGWEPILAYAPPIKPLGNDVLNFTQKIYKDTNGLHKWPKPIELYNFLVARWTRERDIVLEPFLGSGTTIVAAVNLGRRAIGVEIDQKYFDISCKRIERALLQMRLPLDV